MVRRSFCAAKQSEAVSGRLEILRRRACGYYHSQDRIKLKLRAAVSPLHESCWKGAERSTESGLLPATACLGLAARTQHYSYT